ncbi:unnamed protein product [Meloidogyne enterolobii]|uniref:Uncharacterized protein n=1 Tax=Meloidogyne enterolobii TaxID=390850 RepID=A0ACB1AHR8_MELEN
MKKMRLEMRLLEWKVEMKLELVEMRKNMRLMLLKKRLEKKMGMRLEMKWNLMGIMRRR